MPEYKRYNLTLRVVDPTARDKFRMLSRPESFFEIRPNRRPGERGAYSVEMTQSEYEAALEDAQDPESNLLVIEPVRTSNRPPSLPTSTQLQYLAAQDADSLGLTGSGVRIGLIDSGASSGTVSGYTVIAAKSFAVNLDPYNDELGHGTNTFGLAVPASASAAIAKVMPPPGGGGASDTTATAGAYWLADEVGVDVILYEAALLNSTILSDVVRHVASKNIVQVAPNGNSGEDNDGDAGENIALYPAAYSGVLAISAYNPSTDAIWWYSNYGSHTWAASAADEGGGTSSASALAAGIVVRYMTGGKSPGNVASYLASTARPTGASPIYEGNGVLQLSAAEQEIQQDNPPKTDLAGNPMTGTDGEPLTGAAVLEGTGNPEPGACD